MKMCSVSDCAGEIVARGFCNKHYIKYRTYGDPLGGRSRAALGTLPSWIFDHLDHKGDDCLIWPFSKITSGYGNITIDRKSEQVHVVIATIVLGPRPTPKHQCRHLCGNGQRGCVNPRHLSWGTVSQNQMDKISHGTSNRGVNHGKALLTNSDVMEIRVMLDSGCQSLNVAKSFGVSPTTIFNIKAKRSWGWLNGHRR